ncbi:MAG TPA: hypothetical protein VFI42_15345 [Thermomicrobiaceae bacterium]|nr:hypothetical protein [Thermomicrobiaceae bacterium]
MAQRRNQPPPRRPRRGARRTGSSSSVAIVVATSLLVIVAALVAWLAFGFGKSSSSPAAGATPSPTTIALAPSPTATTSETPVATATVTAAPTTAPTPKPTATGTSAETPAPTSTAAPTPAPTTPSKPATGAFGELPPADIPTGNAAGRQMSLDYRLDMSLQQVPQSAPVYELQPRKWTSDDVGALAKSLGLTGEVSDQGGAFRVSGGGELYVAGNFVQYIAGAETATPTTAPLPDDDTAVQTARSWLVQHDLVGANLGAGQVVARDESAGKVQVRIKPADPDTILSATPSATVTLGPGGQVQEADCRWPGDTQQASYGLRAADDLWSDAQQGQGYLEVDPNALPSGNLQGTATITGASIAYTIAGSPSGVQYLVPLVVFNGQATFQGEGTPVPVKVYVPAVSAQSAPRG